MSEIFKQLEHKVNIYKEPIRGVLVWDSHKVPVPVKGTLIGSRYQEYARTAIWTPIIPDASGKYPDTGMESVYVPYHTYNKLLRELAEIKKASLDSTEFVSLQKLEQNNDPRDGSEIPSL